jgi:hypothetical protein
LGPASRCEDEIRTLTPGHEASFIVLDKDPSVDIRNRETIVAVWKVGKRVSAGPLAATQRARELSRIHLSMRRAMRPEQLTCL